LFGALLRASSPNRTGLGESARYEIEANIEHRTPNPPSPSYGETGTEYRIRFLHSAFGVRRSAFGVFFCLSCSALV
jgi:hypothetical protein